MYMRFHVCTYVWKSEGVISVGTYPCVVCMCIFYAHWHGCVYCVDACMCAVRMHMEIEAALYMETQSFS